MTSDNKIEEYLSHAIAGCLVGQIAAARRLSFDDLIACDGESVRSLGYELAELGLDPDRISEALLLALATLFMEGSNASMIAGHLSDLLWTILGPPEGGTPPEIYRRAGVAMLLAFVGLLNSDYVEQHLKQP